MDGLYTFIIQSYVVFYYLESACKFFDDMFSTFYLMP
mgnify:CR=1 FL=1